MPFTSVNDGHNHKWERDMTFTSFDDGHRHRINLRSGLAMFAGGHTHILLGLKTIKPAKKNSQKNKSVRKRKQRGIYG